LEILCQIVLIVAGWLPLSEAAEATGFDREAHFHGNFGDKAFRQGSTFSFTLPAVPPS
jgi:hypothetical protein